LEQPKNSQPPFRKGDQLDVQCDTTAPAGATHIAVLDTAHWPWVLVQGAQGEMWLNFDHVVAAKMAASAK
jgi:hypothetical protein